MAKKIILTGATGLIGSRLCQALLEAGHTVITFSRDRKKLDDLRRGMREANDDNFDGYAFEISDEKAVKKVFARIAKKHRHVDGLINNAGHRIEKVDLDALSSQDWLESLKVNVITPFLLSRAAAALMPKHGSIINIGSIFAVVSADLSVYPKNEKLMGLLTVYGVSKAALVHLTKYLATAYGRKQIRINAVSYGGVANKQQKSFVAKYKKKTAMGRMAELDDLDGVIKFLISDDSKYITGQNIVVDGGRTLY